MTGAAHDTTDLWLWICAWDVGCVLAVEAGVVWQRVRGFVGFESAASAPPHHRSLKKKNRFGEAERASRDREHPRASESTPLASKPEGFVRSLQAFTGGLFASSWNLGGSAATGWQAPQHTAINVA